MLREPLIHPTAKTGSSSGPPSRADLKLAELYQTLGRKISVADQIAAGLRDLILSGDLRPGDRIVESRIAKQLGVGQPTVREALLALEYQGLVVRKANQGCVVTKLTRTMCWNIQVPLTTAMKPRQIPLRTEERKVLAAY